MEEEESICPFCGYKATSDYRIMLHLETQHPEDNTTSPFTIQGEDTASIAAVLALSVHTPASEQEENDNYASCPVEGCGEALLLTELESHIEMHAEEQGASNDDDDDDQEDEGEVSGGRREKRIKLDPKIGMGAGFDTKLSHALRNLEDLDEYGGREEKEVRQARAKAAWKGLLKMPDVGNSKSSLISPSKGKRRLGKSELGPHANEKQMPSWLIELLEHDGEVKIVNKLESGGKIKRVKVSMNMAQGVVPVLVQLLEQDGYTQYAYMCDPSVRHVSKLKREGGFCGYRNIQMMSSFIIGAESQGHEVLNGKIPTIFQIQEYIENAWDLGINSQGRVETGGIRGTRKYIGTPDVSTEITTREFCSTHSASDFPVIIEAQAMLCSLGIACDAQGLKTRKDSSKVAHELLFQTVEQYFTNSCTDYNPKVRCTPLPPIYFQHPGHSMTIVGFEKKRDGSRNLIVFDPMFHDAASVLKLVGETFRHKYPEDMLKAYRRGVKYLKKYNEFELLKLTPPRNN